MIDDADDGGPPGTDGYRIITHLNGKQEKQRYFAVTFAETFMARDLKASQEEHYLRLAGYKYKLYLESTKCTSKYLLSTMELQARKKANESLLGYINDILKAQRDW